MNKKDLLLNYYNVIQEISKIEKNMYNPQFIEWNHFIYLEELRNNISKLYFSIFPEENKEYPIIEFIERIIDEDFTYFDTRLLSKEQMKKHSTKVTRGTISMTNNWMELWQNSKETKEEEVLFLTKELKDENPHCILTFKDVSEVIDFALSFEE